MEKLNDENKHENKMQQIRTNLEEKEKNMVYLLGEDIR